MAGFVSSAWLKNIWKTDDEHAAICGVCKHWEHKENNLGVCLNILLNTDAQKNGIATHWDDIEIETHMNFFCANFEERKK